MAVIPNPSKDDKRNRTCTRFRIIIYDKTTQKRLPTETFHGTRDDAEKYERAQLEKLGRGTFVPQKERRTLRQLCADFMEDQLVRDTATATRAGYKSVFDCHLVPRFGEWKVCAITRKDLRTFCKEMLDAGRTPHTVNRVVENASILFNFAVREEVIERNPLDKYRKPCKVKSSGRVHRGAYTEQEMQALINASKPRDRAMIGVLCFTGIRPGELYALRWLDLNYAERCARITRSWDHRGKIFVPPKTKAGIRTVSLSAWLIEQLEAFRAICGESLDSEALIFKSRRDTPFNPSNVRRDIWFPLIKRAGVKRLDMYSLRHTFATFARASGDKDFNVARHLGHARSTIVDTIYAETLPSGLVGMSDRVTERALNATPSTPNTPPHGPVTPVSGAVTQPLHEIIKSASGAPLNDCFLGAIVVAAANDERINSANPSSPEAAQEYNRTSEIC